MLDLGFSVYISTFREQKEFLKQIKNKDVYIFTSLHIAEEMGEDYRDRAKEMLKWLNEQGFKVIADVSKRTLEVFGEEDITVLAKKLGFYMMRIDYGFSDEEMIEVAQVVPLVFNASTVDIELAKKLKATSGKVFAIHNYYPREYSGLSKGQFETINQRLRAHDISVIGFIPNSKRGRGPLYEGLPTLENQRYTATAVSYFEMMNETLVDGVLLADLMLEPLDQMIIETYEETGVISIPVRFEESAKHLYNQTFTIRIDSPECAYRLQESREFATAGERIEPYHCITRSVGSITCDNVNFLRYSGEIQIIREELPKDYRVNVIGEIDTRYKELCKVVSNGQRIKFIQA